MKRLVILFVFTMLACAYSVSQDLAIHVKDVPDFRREYRVHLGINGDVMTVTARHNDWDWDGSHPRRLEGIIEQPDGKFIAFDPDAPADKIIDRDLVPLVIDACKKIKAMDRKYMEDGAGPLQIVDAYGHTWIRVK